jgi:hypothetical protein
MVTLILLGITGLLWAAAFLLDRDVAAQEPEKPRTGIAQGVQ